MPIYNNAVVLNDGNGERLLYLPSVGFVLAIAAVAAPLLKIRYGQALMALGAVAALFACLAGSMDYVTAGQIRNRVIADTIRLAPKNATVVVLNIPDSNRSARLLGAGFPEAIARAGRSDLKFITCAPSIVETGSPQPLHFTIQKNGEILAQSTASLPFETPESGRAIGTGGCVYSPDPVGKLAPGLETAVLLRVAPSGGNTIYLWFDGVNMRACNPAVCPGLDNADKPSAAG